MRYVLMLVVAAGCAGGPIAVAPSNIGTSPDAATPHVRLLAAEFEDVREVVDMPPLGSWPITFAGSGPMYALVQLSPYVGQFGILADAKRADTGAGFGVTFGYRAPLGGVNSISVDASFEQSSHVNESAGVDAMARRIYVAGRLGLKMDSPLTPFVAAGGGLYSLEFEEVHRNFDLEGFGVMLGGGVDYVPVPALSLRAELALHIWDAAEVGGSGNGGTAETLTLGLGAAFSF